MLSGGSRTRLFHAPAGRDRPRCAAEREFPAHRRGSGPTSARARSARTGVSTEKRAAKRARRELSPRQDASGARELPTSTGLHRVSLLDKDHLLRYDMVMSFCFIVFFQCVLFYQLLFYCFVYFVL